ncbi:M20 family metallopeptidase [Cryptosporangium sp. NPDC051539]|uniref:M20 family metallopeptidase n=1 Tax=Cryptosporangium sp. NPDC051539 TaxID=3363962 RepID=UPI0037A907F9
MTHEVVLLTQQLVRLRTVNDPEAGTAEAPAAAVVEELMRSFGWPVQVEEVAPGRPNVIAVVDGGGGPGPTLLFEGHTDVVTEGARDTWSVDPYSGDIVDGVLWGRGSADMKSGVAAMIHATRRLQLAGPFPGRIVVAALVDEEGMMLGAKHFARSPLAAEVDAAIICEPEAGEICTCAKGAIRLRVELGGAMAHGAMPHQGRNPILPLAPLLAAVAGYERELDERFGEHEHLGRVYLTPTVVQAGRGEQGNVIPAEAFVHLDVRSVPGVDHAEVIARVRALACAAAEPYGVTASVEVVDDRPPVEIPADSPIAAAVLGAHEAVTGEPGLLGGVPGTTDGTILFRDASILSVVYGPGGKWIAHQADEFVAVDEIVTSMNVYVEAARRFLTGA